MKTPASSSACLFWTNRFAARYASIRPSGDSRSKAIAVTDGPRALARDARFCPPSPSSAAASSAVAFGLGAWRSNVRIVCGTPSSKTSKSDCASVVTGRPFLSTTVTSTTTASVRAPKRAFWSGVVACAAGRPASPSTARGTSSRDRGRRARGFIGPTAESGRRWQGARYHGSMGPRVHKSMGTPAQRSNPWTNGPMDPWT